MADRIEADRIVADRADPGPAAVPIGRLVRRADRRDWVVARSKAARPFGRC